MAKRKKKFWIPIIIVVFVFYIFFAAQPVGLETVLKSQWITPIEYDVSAESEDVSEPLMPFLLNGKFGYIDVSGNLSFNKNREGYVSFSDSRWAEYQGAPSQIEIKSPLNENLFTVRNPNGYPFFLDGKNFILAQNQNAISKFNDAGNVLWTYYFDAPVTCINVNADLVMAGLLNGTIVLLNDNGNEIFSFEVLGSRVAVIYACKISNDGTKLAVISGLDKQRFLLFEQHGESYRVIYHEYIGDGYRRSVMLSFIDNDKRAAFEREGGIGIYDIQSRQSTMIPLEGNVYAMDSKGIDDMFFVITSLPPQEKKLVGIRYPGMITCEAPFKSESIYLNRNDSSLIIGGGDTLISFVLKKR